jgi:cytochrome c-type biogenesis protein CcmH/NrfG
VVVEARRPEDEISIPPASPDLEADDVVSPPAAVLAHAEALDEVRPPPAPAKRSGFARFAFGVAAVMCLAGLVRVTIARLGHAPERVAQAASAPAEVVPPAAAAIPEVPSEPIAADEAAPAAAEPEETAVEAKKRALSELEKRNLTAAIEAGEHSVSLDPSDGNAWLILGAAYQDTGRVADARRCYGECTKLAKRGEVKECSYMLH